MKIHQHTLFMRNQAFRRKVGLFMIALLLPTMLILGAYLVKASSEALKRIEQDATVQLDRTARNLDLLIYSIDRMSIQFAYIPFVSSYLQRPFETNPYDSYLVKEQMRDWTFSNPMLHSFYMHVFQNDRVLTSDEGIYASSEFYDHDFLMQMRQSNLTMATSWSGVRKIPAQMTEPSVEVVTFVRPIPAGGSLPLGALDINLNKTQFMNMLYDSKNNPRHDVLLIDPAGRLLTSNNLPSIIDQTQVDTLLPMLTDTSDTISLNIRLDDRDFMLSARQLADSGWLLIKPTLRSVYTTEMKAAWQTALLIALIVTIVGFALAYLFAWKLYIPWKRILQRIHTYPLSIQPTGQSNNDYEQVDQAIGSMITSLQQNESIVRSNLARELLQEQLVDETSFRQRLSELNLQMPHQNFTVLLIAWAVPDTGGSQQPQQTVFLYSAAEAWLKRVYPLLGTVLDRNKLGFILNVDEQTSREQLLDRIRSCRQHLTLISGKYELSPIQFSMGELQPLHLIYESHKQAQMTLAYRAFRTDDDVMVVSDAKKSAGLAYPATHQTRLVQVLQAGDRDQAAQLTVSLFERYVFNRKYTEPQLQQMFTMLLSSVLGSLAQDGCEIGDLLADGNFLHFDNCSHAGELLQAIQSKLNQIITHIQTLGEQQQERSPVVRRAIAYMENNYNENLSISHIADALGISSSHLSRTFKSEIGKSPLEYLTVFRLEQSKQLLANPQLSVSEISLAIGYNHVHTFIRSFKQYIGSTPGEFRKNLIS